MNFTDNEDYLIINKEQMNINYNGVEKKIIEIYFLTSSKGKLETSEYVIKYSKNILSIFDKKTNNLIDTLFFNQNFVPVVPVVPVINEENSRKLFASFALKTDHFINLYNTTLNGINYFEVSILKGDNIILTEDIISKTASGSDTIYTTKSGNVLVIGTIRNSKWNGIPIGKVFG